MRAILYAVPVAVALIGGVLARSESGGTRGEAGRQGYGRSKAHGVLCAQQDSSSLVANKALAARRLVEVSGGVTSAVDAMAAIDDGFAHAMGSERNAFWKDHRDANVTIEQDLGEVAYAPDENLVRRVAVKFLEERQR